MKAISLVAGMGTKLKHIPLFFFYTGHTGKGQIEVLHCEHLKVSLQASFSIPYCSCFLNHASQVQISLLFYRVNSFVSSLCLATCERRVEVLLAVFCCRSCGTRATLPCCPKFCCVFAPEGGLVDIGQVFSPTASKYPSFPPQSHGSRWWLEHLRRKAWSVCQYVFRISNVSE